MLFLIKNNTFLQEPLQKAIEIYQQDVVPRLTKKNKTIAISTAVAISLIYFIRDRYFKPPKNIRHISYQGYFDVIKSMITKESYWDRAYRLSLPTIDSETNNGLYVVYIYIHI
jgi:hypothetical protein